MTDGSRCSFRRAVELEAVAEGRSLSVDLAGWPVVVCRSGGRFYALADRCSHAEFPLAGGRVRGGSITCPLHGARFELATGRCLGAPAVRGVRSFPTREVEGWLEVAVPERPPGERDLLDGTG